MNNIWRLLLLVLLLLTSCRSPAVPTASVAAAKTAVPAHHSASVMPAPRETRTIKTPTPTSAGKADADSIVIHIQNSDDQPGFVMDCPQNVVCDQHYDYRAYRYEDDRVFLYLSFDPNVIGTSTYEELVSYYNYLNMEVRFPERTTTASRFFYANRYPVARLTEPNADGVIVEFLAYEEHRLRGRISGTATRITEFRTSNQPGCRIDDQGGICFFDEPANIPFVITFDLTLVHPSGAPGA